MYTPDRAKLLKISYQDQAIYKIFATWYGGYLHGDSWKLNSGIQSVEKDGDYFNVIGYSGSVYRIHKDSEGTSGYTEGVLQNFIKQGEDNGVTFHILPLEDLEMFHSVLKSQNENSKTTSD